MARVFACADAAQALLVIAALRRLYDYPRPGIHVGGGIHVPQDEGDSRTPGFTRTHRRLWRRRSDGTFFYFCDATHDGQLADAIARARCTAAQRTLLDGRTAAAANDPAFDDPSNFDEQEPA